MYDVVVLGLGVIGSSAAYHLARRGHSVIAFDTFPRGHVEGASHGTSRIFRQVYSESDAYVPLAVRAREFWQHLEEESGYRLMDVTGALVIGLPETAMIAGALRSARHYDLAHEFLSSDAIAGQFPFKIPSDFAGVYDPNGGVLWAERCMSAFLDLAAIRGVELRFGSPVHAWAADSSGVRVETDECTFFADRLIVAAGAWTGYVLPDLKLPLVVRRVVNGYFASAGGRRGLEKCPVFLWDVPEGEYYGIPELSGDGIKLGRHDVGEDVAGSSVRRDIDAREVDMLRSTLNRYLPEAGGSLIRALTCTYTLTPDRHFIVDRHPEHPQVVFGCGFSGHGFKFAGVIGEALADLAATGYTDIPVGFLRMDRFGSIVPS